MDLFRIIRGAGVPGQVFVTTTQYAFAAAVAVVGAASNACSAVLQRQHP